MTRLALYARIAQRMAALGLLISFWGVMLAGFAAHMLPRLRYLAGAPVGIDSPCGRPECDFSVFWPAGQLAHAHNYEVLYGGAAFIRAVNHLLPPCPGIETFFYPPTLLPLLAGISHLPFEAGFFVWTLGLAALAAAALRAAGLGWGVVAAGLLSPAALLNLELGELGVIGGALLLAGLLLTPRRPVAAGALLGLLAAKPQIGLLAPAYLLARQSWRGLAAMAAVVVVLTSTVTWGFGPEVWHAYATLGRAETARIMAVPFSAQGDPGWGVSVYWLARGLGAAQGVALAVQAAAALAAIATLFALRPRGFALVEITVYLSLLATPYGYSTDMVAYSLVLAESLRRRRWRLDLLDALLFLWPGLCFAVSQDVGVPLTPLFVAVAATRAALRARPAVLPGPAQE